MSRGSAATARYEAGVGGEHHDLDNGVAGYDILRAPGASGGTFT
ncbi:hypothetical protein [Nonomuraea basaltis]|nr:hypothetical protein [Nonomuraea basaltis]